MKDGKPLMSFGVMGGSMQPQGHAQIIVNMLDFGMNLQEAGDAARVATAVVATDRRVDDGWWHVFMERGFSDETGGAGGTGPYAADTDGSFGGYQAILRDHEQGVYYGASEVRKDGQAAGY